MNNPARLFQLLEGNLLHVEIGNDCLYLRRNIPKSWLTVKMSFPRDFISEYAASILRWTCCWRKNG